MKFTKDMIGTTIFGYPTGNNIDRYNKVQKLVEFKIISIQRKYVTLSREGIHEPTKYDKETGASEWAVRSGYELNEGYVFSLTEQQSKNKNILKKLLTIIRYDNILDDCTTAQQQEIITILKDHPKIKEIYESYN